MEETNNMTSRELFKQYMKTRTTLERNLSSDDKQKLQQEVDNTEYKYDKKKEKQRIRYQSDNDYKQKVIENAKKAYNVRMKKKNITKNKQQYENEYAVLDLDVEDNVENNIEVQDAVYVKPKIDHRNLF